MRDEGKEEKISDVYLTAYLMTKKQVCRGIQKEERDERFRSGKERVWFIFEGSEGLKEEVENYHRNEGEVMARDYAHFVELTKEMIFREIRRGRR